MTYEKNPTNKEHYFTISRYCSMLGYFNSCLGKKYCIGVLLSIFCLLYVILSFDLREISTFPAISIENSHCFTFLRQFNFTVRVTVIDVNFLKCTLQRTNNLSNRTVNMAVDKRNIEMHFPSFHPLFRIIPMVDNSSKDYWEFHEDGVVRIVPRFQVDTVGKISYPSNIPLFIQFWKRSQKVECKKGIVRETSNIVRTIPLSYVDHMVTIRDSLIENGAYPFLSGGTLLGWYRECTIIPHTQDIDFSVLATEYKISLINNKKSYPKSLLYRLFGIANWIFLWRMLGKPSDGLELTLRIGKIKIDIFFVYHEGNTSWVGGLDGDLRKYKYTYPKIEQFCSADLLDRHFFVPCNVEEIVKYPCLAHINQFNFTARIIVIDINVLECMLQRTNSVYNRSVTIAVEKRDMEHFPSFHPLFRIIFMVDNSSKDYWEFHDDGVVRIVPRFRVNTIENISYPANVHRFLEFWRRSEKVECKNIEMNRNSSDKSQYIPLSSVEEMTKVKDIFILFDSFPFFSGGTLLGWYRECTIIPHTKDIDFSVMATEYKRSLMNHLKAHNQLSVRRVLGKPTDGFELTLSVEGIAIDIFFVYHEGNTSWVGGLNTDLTKYKYTYPKIEKICSADLLDHHFFVPCNVEEIVRREYGPNWMNDHPTHQFSWSSSHSNVKPNGKWPEEMRYEVYKTYS